MQFGFLHGCKTCPLEARFQSRERPNAIRCEIQQVQWLADDRSVCFSQSGIATQEMYDSVFIVMQKPLSLPLVTLLPPSCIVQPLQNWQ
jgi:hypothetical protein